MTEKIKTLEEIEEYCCGYEEYCRRYDDSKPSMDEHIEAKSVHITDLRKWAIKHVKALEPKIHSIRFKSLEDKKLNVKYWSLVMLRDWIKENFNLKESDLE